MLQNKETENYRQFLNFTGSSIEHKKQGRGTLQVSLDGMFFLGGDYGVDDSVPVNSFLKFDFTEDESKMIQLPPFPIARSCLTSALIDEHLYIIGGYNGSYSLSDVHRFDFITGTWESVTPLTNRKASISSVTYKNKIFVFGGVQGSRAFCEIESYNPCVNKWSITGHLHFKRSGCGVEKFQNKVYIFGGINRDTDLPLEIYDLETNKVVTRHDIVVDLHSFGITLTYYDNIPYFVLAGGGNTCSPSKKTYLFNILEEKLEKVSSLNYKRQYVKLIQLNNTVYAVGGYDGKKVVGDCEYFDMKQKRWLVKKAQFPYCGYSVFHGKIDMTIRGFWKNNELNGKVLLNHHWKGTYQNNKKKGVFTNDDTEERIFFYDNFQVSESKYNVLQKIAHIKIPENFTCPISYEIMLDPVITSNGSTYDRKNISEWLIKHKTDPLTRVPINTVLTPNNLLKKIIREFLESKKIFL